MIRPSEYVIRELLHTAKKGRRDVIIRICEKYMARYKEDRLLVETCSMVLKDLDEVQRSSCMDACFEEVKI